MESIPVLLVIFIVGIYLLSSIKILAEYERGVIFRLGRLLPHAKGPGVILVFAPIDRNVRLQAILDEHTSPWGVKVTLVSVKQVDLPEQMIRAIGRQAEAEREKRAKIIHAEGEYTAAEKLAMAAEVIQRQPVAIQLRYLQTLVEIGAEKNTTVVFPLPIDFLNSLMG